MIQQVEAIYENRLLRPLQPLHLRESARVQESVSEDASDPLAELIDYKLLEYGRTRTSSLAVAPTFEEVRAQLSPIPDSMTELIISEPGEF